MIEIILILIAIIIIIYVIVENKKSNKKSFDTIINKEYINSEKLITFEEKNIYFIQKLREDLLEKKYKKTITECKEKNSNNIKKISSSKVNRVEELLEKGYNEIEICKTMSIGKGEYLLILNFLNIKNN